MIERYHCDISLDRNENPLGFRYHICGVMITWARGKRFSEWGSRAAVPEGVPICLADCAAIDASLPCSEPKASRESGVEHGVSSGERAALPGGIPPIRSPDAARRTPSVGDRNTE